MVRTTSKASKLEDYVPFRDCSRQQLELIARHAEDVRFPARSVLMREGRLGHECFVILDGEADVKIRGRCMAVLSPGDIVGEMALLSREPRTATVTTTTPVRALVFSTQDFNVVLDRVPPVARHLMQTLTRRLRAVQAA
jgi:CRP-like cAMP-binding protein